MSLSLACTQEALFKAIISHEFKTIDYLGLYYSPMYMQWDFCFEHRTMNFKFRLREEFPQFQNPNGFEMAMGQVKEIKSYLNPLWC
jgi:hypothetical protein